MPHLILFILALLLAGPVGLVGQSGLRVEVIGAQPDERVDSAWAEFRVGRHWHADRVLSEAIPEPDLRPADRLMWAQARAGYRHWSGVIELLEPVDWLDGIDSGRGWLVLARAHQALGHPDRAASAYQRALTLPNAVTGAVRSALWARVAALEFGQENLEASHAALDSASSVPRVAEWQTLQLLADAQEGTPSAQELRPFWDRIQGTGIENEARLIWSRVLRHRGDTLGSAALWSGHLDGSSDPLEGAHGWAAIADAARLNDGDSLAVAAYLRALNAGPGHIDAQHAARHLVRRAPDLGSDDWARIARALDRAGAGSAALQAYDRHVDVARAEAAEPDARARVERARLMTTVSSRREAGIDEWRELAQHDDPAVGVRTLTLWRALRQRQGETAKANTLRRWLLERYPDSEPAAEILYLRGDAAQDRGDLDTALRWYDETARTAPTRSAAGLARMRAAQIHLSRGDSVRALDGFEAYLRDFPEGRRWQEAAYWSARLQYDLGDTVGARDHVRRILREAPVSYYAVLSADLDAATFDRSLPSGPTAPVPHWMLVAMADIDLLIEAGLERGVTHEIEAVQQRAATVGPDALIQLAEQLIARRRTLEGIRVAWQAQEQGAEWSLRLARAVYPFPYRAIVEREARALGLDPLLLAGLIRQESAFVHDIQSGAGAVGLMQVMPATGTELARRLGFSDFTPAALENPDVNIHLGARFLHDLLERFDHDLPLALSAYNAGPTRARRWARLPEAADPHRFTERIPFSETRGYVKNVTRNLRLYQQLWADTPADRNF
jgi:soluble lytic murein transglycosylase